MMLAHHRITGGVGPPARAAEQDLISAHTAGTLASSVVPARPMREVRVARNAVAGVFVRALGRRQTGKEPHR